MPERMGFHIDSSVCTGCKACQIACKDKNNLPVEVTWRRVVQYGGGSWVSGKGGPPAPRGIFTYSLSVACMHCAEPACAAVCPQKAISRRPDGIVAIDAGKCAGCRSCEQACPYGAPQFHAARGVMTKCDFCGDLLEAGRKPVCVAACPMRAIDAGPLRELRARFGNVDAVEPLPRGSTGPAVAITPHRDARRGRKGAVIALPAAT